MKGEVLRVKPMVEDILEDSRRARNDNKFLVMKVWCETSAAEFNVQMEEVTIDINKLDRLPSSASILRSRRKLVEDRPELDADEDVKKRRARAEEEMRAINKWDERAAKD